MALATAIELSRGMDMTFWLPETEAALLGAREMSRGERNKASVNTKNTPSAATVTLGKNACACPRTEDSPMSGFTG